MIHLRERGLRLPALGGALGIISLSGIGLWLRGRSRRKPSADELMKMDQASFDRFIRSTGLEGRVASALADSDGSSH